MNMTIYTANCTGNKKNCIYPNKCIIDNEDDFMAAIESDHVLARYEKFYRGNDNFLESDCTVMDCDNDHSEDPGDWIDMQEFADSLPDVALVVAPSRHHMKEKDGKAARPRFHVYFPIETITDKNTYEALKKAIHERFPFFDDECLDAARFIFGAPQQSIVWQEGEITIDCLVKGTPETDVIPAGQRNSTMSRFAGKILKKFGDCDKAYELFREKAEKCDPPLDDEELDTIWGSAQKFYKKISAQAGYIPPGEYEFGRESLRPEDYSDIGQAKVIAREYGDEVKYSTATDLIRYDGISWVESKQKAIGAVIEFLDMQLKDAQMLVESAMKKMTDSGLSRADIEAGGKRFIASLSVDQLKTYDKYVYALKYLAFVMKRRDMKYIVSAIQAMKPMVDIPVADLDADPFLLNTPSCTYDLRQGLNGAREHSASDLITKVTAVDPSDEGKSLWLDAINGFFCGDKDLIDYVQQMSALGIIGRVYLELMIIAYGLGSNGKSTYWNTIGRVLGSYCGNMSADALTVGCKRNVQYEMAEAKAKRLLIAAELEEGTRLNTSFVKQMSSTDPIFAQKKYKDPFSFIPSHTMVLYTNHLPRVSANDDGTWRRLVVIPFKAKITGKADIKNYSEYLFENAGGYILKWLIEGAEKLINNEFKITPPQAVVDAIEKYKRDNDWLGHFITDCCECDPSYETKSGELYQEYRAYSARSGEYTRGTTDFYNALSAAGYRKQKKHNGSFVLGIRLKPTDFGE